LKKNGFWILFLKGSILIEKDLRKIVARCWDGWIDWLEPRGAAGIGRPDADLMIDRVIAPIELKIGLVTEHISGGALVGALVGAWIRPSKIRPDQISWAHRFRVFGGTSFWLFADDSEGVKKIVVAWHLIDHRFRYKEFCFEYIRYVDVDKFSEQIVDFVRDVRQLPTFKRDGSNKRGL
jgi:hypothetical protein